MSTFVGKSPFSNPRWVALETMHFHITHTKSFRTTSFRIQGVPLNDLGPMKNCPGVQGSLNWMPGYYRCGNETQYANANETPRHKKVK